LSKLTSAIKTNAKTALSNTSVGGQEGSSEPLEVLFDLAPVRRSITGRPCGQIVEYDVRRSSSRMCAIFSAVSGIVRLHRRMTGHRRGDFVDVHPRRANRESSPSRSSASVRSVASAILGAGRGYGRHGTSPPNSSISKPRRSRSRRAPAAPAPLRRQTDDQRLQQTLAFEPARRQPLSDPLEQHSLVRDMLVDDGDAFLSPQR
jgi:hypothetical protein